MRAAGEIILLQEGKRRGPERNYTAWFKVGLLLLTSLGVVWSVWYGLEATYTHRFDQLDARIDRLDARLTRMETILTENIIGFPREGTPPGDSPKRPVSVPPADHIPPP